MSDVKQRANERLARVKAAINLEPHDRVPLVAAANSWPAVYSKKHTLQETFYSFDVAVECFKKLFSDWNEWDAFNASMQAPAPALDATGSGRYSIPGQSIPPHAEFQHPDLTLMRPEEYAKLIDDPVRFQLEVIAPRLCQRLGSDDPYVRLTALAKAALYFERSTQKLRSYSSLWINEYGIPPLYQGSVLMVPIDFIADKLRGFHQGLLDIKQRPDEVQAACDALLPSMLYECLYSMPPVADYPLIFNPQHVSPFISPKDYDRVYWPTFKKLVDELVKRGFKIWVFFENNQEQHLERYQDLPKGKVVAHMEATDLAQTKKALGGKLCIAGGMPAKLLARGTPEEVKERTVSVLRLFEDEPGFIMTCDTNIPANVKPENLRAWISAVKEHGYLGGTTGRGAEKDETLENGDGIAERLSSAGGADGIDDVVSPIAPWESARADFGQILGDERVIKENWDDLERLLLRFIYSLVK